MKSVFRVYLTLTICFACIGTGCEKSPLSEPPASGSDTTATAPPVLPGQAIKPSGYFYADCSGNFQKFSATDSSIALKIFHANIFGAAASVMILDSNSIVAGNTNAMGAYSTGDGRRLWLFKWDVPLPASLLYREPVRKDSLILFTTQSQRGSPTSVLYCFVKNTGAFKWVASADDSRSSSDFSSTPVVVEDKVILVTQDAEVRQRLTAYRVSDGKQLWSILPAKTLSLRLKTFNGFIYSFRNEGISCYSSVDGKLQWEQEQPDNYVTSVSTSSMQGQDWLVQLSDSRYDVYALSKANGKPELSASIKAIPEDQNVTGCILQNNKLVITSKYSEDSLTVRCFDLATKAQSWKIRLKNGDLGGDASLATPVLANNFFLVPTVEKRIIGDFACSMYFIGFDGKVLKKIPFDSGIPTNRFAYEEMGVYYNQENRLIRL